jgi:hypothetical protein
MAIPRETSKELIVVVENEAVEVAISPPILDSIMVVGQPPGVDPRTVYFTGYVDDTLNLRTASGLSFEVQKVGQPTVIVQEQVRTGPLPPGDGGIAINANEEIYISTNDRSIWIASGQATTVADQQVYVRYTSGWPASGAQDDIMINAYSRSIRRWTD